MLSSLFPAPARVRAFLFILALFFIASPALVSAASTSATWISGLDTSYVVDLSYSLCPNATGNTTISATVKGLPSGNTVIDANVFATIRKPDNSTSDVNFTNNLSGTYTATYNFDVNGTYLIQAHAYKAPSTNGDVNGYVYLGDLNWTVAFVNDAFDIDIGEVGTIRNTVENADGNAVYDINANTTLYYPSGTAADANASMGQSVDGEFTYSFFGPSPAGTYTVSSLFQCGNRYAHNGTGTFIVNAAATGGTGSSGSGGDSGSGTGGGGGGGGGGTAAAITSIDFDPALGKNAPSEMRATVQNFTFNIHDYTLNYTVKAPSGSIYTESKAILAVAPKQTTTVVLDYAFVPLELGTYVVQATLTNLNKSSLYDTYSNTYNVDGTHSVALDVQSGSTQTTTGLSFPFTINVLNSGDFPEEAQITWYLFDSSGEQYLESFFTSTLQAGESQSFTYPPFIQLDAPLGTYTLVVEVLASGVKQTKELTFTVASPGEYYAQLIADLELRAEQIDDKLDDLQQRGFDVAETNLVLLAIQVDLSRTKGLLLAGKLEELGPLLLDLSARITRLSALVDALEQQSPLLSREGLNMILYVGAALLLILFVWLLFWLLHREKKERERKRGITPLPASPSWLTSLLFVEKGYYNVAEREKLKRKPLIGTLVGIMEGES